MKQVSNWVFGSFFRTIGRILVYILIGFLLSYFLKDIKLPGLFNVLDVYADTTDNWFFNLSHYGSGNFNFINHTSNGVSWLTNTTRDVSFNIGWTTGTESDIYLDYYLPTHTSDVVIASNGVSLSYFTDLSLRQGYLYNVNSYFCANSSINSTTGQTRIGYSASNSYQASYDYSSTNITQLGNVLRGRTTSDNLYNCVLYSSLVVPSANGSWVNIKITSSSSLSDRRLYFIGYDIRELGIYSDTVRNIIQNSGFATASSVNQVQSTVSQMQTDIQNQTQQQHQDSQDTQNLMKDETAPSVSGMSNDAIVGWLPAGPLDSVLTMPLQMLYSISNNLSNSCTGLNVPLPFVNSTLNIPCIYDIYNQITGLPALINTFGTVAAGFIMYKYLLWLYHWVEKRISLKGDNDEMWGE